MPPNEDGSAGTPRPTQFLKGRANPLGEPVKERRTMKSAVLTGLRKMKLVERPVPRLISRTDVLVRMKAIGVCGSDVHYYLTGRIGSQVVKYPFAVGHECSGIVESVGSSVKSLKPGDLVAIEPAINCGSCDQCRVGRPHTCRKIKFLGCPGQIAGCLSEYIVMPEANCIKMPTGMTAEQGALAEPLAIGLYAVRSAGNVKDRNVGILGYGPIGMSVHLMLKACGVGRVYVTDKIAERLKLAKKTGAVWAGNPDVLEVDKAINGKEKAQLDIVFDCCGKQAALDQAISILKPGGKLMIIGIPTVDRVSFKMEDLRRKEITLQNVRRQNGCDHDAVRMIGSRKIRPDPMITHRFALKDVKKAFDVVAGYRDGVMKALIKM